jgi:hypothetical protein
MATAPTSLPPWWAFAVALAGLAVLWFWIPSGHGWIGLLIVGGALLYADQDADRRGAPRPLDFLGKVGG